jgi:MEMO1 family protein
MVTVQDTKDIRDSRHAGTFYPGDKATLSTMLKKLLSRTSVKLDFIPKAVIVPHAGYVYSGETAASAFKLFEAASSQISRVILLATAHYSYLDGLAVGRRSYKTPLGTYEVDEAAISKLEVELGPYNKHYPVATTREHSDEVEIPFLQTILPKAKLVPVIVGHLPKNNLLQAAKAVSAICDSNTIIVTSSDFTHYGMNFDYMPPFEEKTIKEGLHKLDHGAIDYILKNDVNGFLDYVSDTGITICGVNPIALLLKISETNGWKENTLLKYTTSGDLTGDYNHSVSYCAISIGRLGGP